jgi:hypothetical protein
VYIGNACSAAPGVPKKPVDQVVVGHRRQPLEGGLALLEIDAGHRRLVDAGVALALDEVAQGVPDGGGLDQPGGELVEHRLEGVVVVPVDQHDVGVGVLQRLRGTDAAEAAAEDQDAWAGLGRVGLCGHVIAFPDGSLATIRVS